MTKNTLHRSRGGPQASYRQRSALLLLPYLLGVLFFVGLPLLISLALSFFTYDGLSTPAWVGLSNFREIFREPFFRVALVNSLSFVFLSVPLRLLAALGLALLLSRPRPRQRPVPRRGLLAHSGPRNRLCAAVVVDIESALRSAEPDAPFCGSAGSGLAGEP